LIVPFPACPFWDFSLALYAKPGVAPACLRLQERRGVDVNLLLFCLWLGRAKARRVSAADIAALRSHISVIHDEVVRPLRQARAALKRMLGQTALEAEIAALRAAVKRYELDAEHVEQVLLAEFGTRGLGTPRPDSDPVRTGQANAAAYLATLDAAAPNAEDRADLAAIIAFLGKE
jgi:uncharacterized protein (TIGR02444 family)